ncbi:helix-turn-helix transcriptional regulator [Vannielia litorea]|uniref:helix-turn-helix transcriptional regulator n=1 Tax=Vannielia litorea TaxID=1217970 RepID=UPI001C982024|nr:helix-turn-helix domain-containing protein [Vannielia litorea]MBY6046693.1 helix-turn-helix domain-containing protein [Vannielia litorea]MBY6074107.1 helix-turn-helix domain-containing protein [Vannielia litorea]
MSHAMPTTPYLTREEAAEQLRVSPRTLDRMHASRSGPPRTTVGRRVLYRPEALEEWLKARELGPRSLV